MELAVNTFSKGLQTDTHPMVQGTDTLSDALNATFITMNGNEVVLQNDLGNRRVDNAYLPAGYEPVGIKEYGGIIYLALYNPITNRSLIGSFPSPERDISGTDIDGVLDDVTIEKDVIHPLTETHSFQYDPNNNEYIYYLNKDTVLIPISSSTALHPGDKFTLYCNDFKIIEEDGTLIEDLPLYISNYNLEKFRDLKRKYTLSLGILNSSNEFVDITSSLERFDDNGDLIKTEFKSEEDKFNTGYFICPKAKPLSSESTLDRDSIASNVYSYKLVGPLYLKAELSHAKDFSYKYSVELFNEGKNNEFIAVTVQGTSHYDFHMSEGICEYNSIEKPLDLLGITYNPAIPYWPLDYDPNQGESHLFNMFPGWQFRDVTIFDGDNVEVLAKEESQYSINTDLKTVSEILVFRVYTRNFLDRKYNIYLEVCGYYDKDNMRWIHIENLSKTITVDLSKISSGTCTLTDWRFYKKTENSRNYIEISYGFDVNNREEILEIGLSEIKFKGLKIYYTYNDTNEYIVNEPSNKIMESGVTVISYEYQNTIEERALTPIIISYTKVTGNVEATVTHLRFILNTHLFDECYSPTRENYIRDYVIFLNNPNISGITQSYINPRDLSSRERTIKETKLRIVPHFEGYDPQIDENRRTFIENSHPLIYTPEAYTLAKEDDSNEYLEVYSKTNYLPVNFGTLTVVSEDYPSEVVIDYGTPGVYYEEDSENIIESAHRDILDGRPTSIMFTYKEEIRAKYYTTNAQFARVYMDFSYPDAQNHYIYGSNVYCNIHQHNISGILHRDFYAHVGSWQRKNCHVSGGFSDFFTTINEDYYQVDSAWDPNWCDDREGDTLKLTQFYTKWCEEACRTGFSIFTSYIPPITPTKGMGPDSPNIHVQKYYNGEDAVYVFIKDGQGKLWIAGVITRNDISFDSNSGWYNVDEIKYKIATQIFNNIVVPLDRYIVKRGELYYPDPDNINYTPNLTTKVKMKLLTDLHITTNSSILTFNVIPWLTEYREFSIGVSGIESSSLLILSLIKGGLFDKTIDLSSGNFVDDSLDGKILRRWNGLLEDYMLQLAGGQLSYVGNSDAWEFYADEKVQYFSDGDTKTGIGYGRVPRCDI